MADQPTAAPAGDGNGPHHSPASPSSASTSRTSRSRIPARRNRSRSPSSRTVEIGLRTRASRSATNVYECVLTITVTATAAGKSVFLVEASQAGLFTIRGVAAADMQPVLAIHCPNVLFPYARETVADAIMRTGFPPVHLAPINFEMLYQQQLAQMQQQAPAVTN